MNSIVILGAGNVSYHLTKALIKGNLNVKQIFNRTLQNAKVIGDANKISYTDKIDELEKAELYIITSADASIEEVSLYIPFSDALVVHTSGSLPMSVLKGSYRKGVLYPLQTFTKDRKMIYDNIPFFIEAEEEEDVISLKYIAGMISREVYELDFNQRMQIQMCGVWVNNFVNHLYQIASQICENNNLPFSVLKPIIKETYEKAMEMDPLYAQTGPAKRGDDIIINRHLDILQNDFIKRKIYQSLTNSIKRTYENDKL